MSKREISLDTIAGLLIIHMIVGHIFQWCKLTYTVYYQYMNILFFFMPWFFYKSGMFFKEENINIVLAKIWKRYLIPFIIFTLIGHSLYCIKMYIEGDTQFSHYIISPIRSLLLSGSTGGNLPLWFLSTLSLVNILFLFTHKHFKLTCIVFIIIPFLINFFQLKNLPLYLSNTCTGIFFYGMGYYLKTLQYNKFIFIISGIGYILLYIYIPSIVDMRSNSLLCGNYIIWIISSMLGIIFINNIFKRFTFLNLLPLSSIGRNSMSYYATHWIVLTLILIMAIIVNITDAWSLFMTMFISCMTLLPLINLFLQKKPLKFIIGK